MTFLDLKRLSVVQLTNHYLLSFHPKSSFLSSSFCTLTEGAASPTTMEDTSSIKATTPEVAPKKASNLSSINEKQKLSKKLTASLGKTTLSQRTIQILNLVLDQHVSFLENSVMTGTPAEGAELVLDYLRSSAGRKFIISFMYKGFSAKSGSLGTADQRLVKYASSCIALLPAFCSFIETGVAPESEVTARALAVMAKAYHTVAPDLGSAL